MEDPGFGRVRCLFEWLVFAKFRPEKNNFDPYEGFFIGKKKKLKFVRFQTFGEFRFLFFFKSPESYDNNFQKVAKNYRRILLFVFYLHI